MTFITFHLEERKKQALLLFYQMALSPQLVCHLELVLINPNIRATLSFQLNIIVSSLAWQPMHLLSQAKQDRAGAGLCVLFPRKPPREISLPSMTSRTVSKIQRPAESLKGCRHCPGGLWITASGRMGAGFGCVSHPWLLLKSTLLSRHLKTKGSQQLSSFSLENCHLYVCTHT